MVDRGAPSLAAAYRGFRDELHVARMKPKETPFGFSLVGDPSMQDGTFEPEETQLMRELLSDADRLLDIGANVGYYTCLSRSLGKPVVAFEPLPSNLRLLMRNLEANQFSDTELWPVGLSDQQGLLPLYGGSTGASMLAGWSGASSAYRVTVPVTTLDTVIHGRFAGEKLFIKIDVEGAEYGVLRGAEQTALRTPRPVWLVEVTYKLHRPEVNRQFVDTFEFFWSKGYEARAGVGERRVVTREDVRAWAAQDDPKLPAYNWLFS